MARFVLFVTALFSMCLGIQAQGISSLKGTYFSQLAPLEAAELFMDGHISKQAEAEMCAGFTNGGTSFYYNAKHRGQWTIFEMHLQEGGWTAPSPISFTEGYTDRDFTISPDGQRMYFGSDRPVVPGEAKSSSLDIFVSERDAAGNWSQPKSIAAINTQHTENYPSVDAQGNLFFFSNRNEGFGGCEIYVSAYQDGSYKKAQLLSEAINSPQHDWDSFIAPDGSYIIFSSMDRPNTIGKQDLYIAFKDVSGQWTQAVNMGPRINSTDDEICPSVTADGKYFFFTSRRRGLADIFWIDAGIIEELKSQAF